MALVPSLKRVTRLAQRARKTPPPRELTLQERFQEQWQHLSAIPNQVKVTSGEAIVPGVTFWLDEEQGNHSVTGEAARGGGLHLQTSVHEPGRWMGLHFGLGDVDLSDTAVLGVYSRQRAPRSCTWRMCLRSGTPDGFVDHFFDKHVVAYNAPAMHVDTLEINAQRSLPRRATWRELVLFFHPESFDATLQDLRLFTA